MGSRNEKKPRRRVNVSPLVPRQGRPELWAFGYEDYAHLFGVSIHRIRQMASKPNPFDFGDLEAICAEWLKRNVGRLVDRGEL